MLKKLVRILLHPVLIRLIIGLLVGFACWYSAQKGWLPIDEKQRLLMAAVMGSMVFVVLLVVYVQQLWNARGLEKGIVGQAKVAASQAEAALRPELEELNQVFTQAISELNGGDQGWTLPGTGGLFKRPWVMVIGPPAAGKTSALKFSPLRFSSLGRQVEGVGGTRNCVWWLADELVVLDTAGRYSVRQDVRDEWTQFLRLLRRYRPDKPIHGAIVQVGIDALLDSDPVHAEETALHLRERLRELIEQLEVRFPVQLVFSKCDQLDGFSSFFGGLSREERDAAWGFELDVDALPAGGLEDAFARGYQSLVDRLLPYQSSRLDQLATPEQRDAALAFTQELSSRKNLLQKFVKTLFEPRRNQDVPWLRGVYFCSALTGPNAPMGRRHQQLRALRLGALPIQPTPQAEGTFFLKGIYASVQALAERPLRLSRRGRQRRLLRLGGATLLGCLLTLLVSCYLGNDYITQEFWIDEVTARVDQLEQTTRVGLHSTQAVDATLQSLEELQVLLGMTSVRGVSEAAQKSYFSAIDYFFVLAQQDRLDAQLRAATTYAPNRPEGDDIFFNGFRALKVNYILDGLSCQDMPPDGDEASRFMGEYFADQFALAWDETLSQGGVAPDAPGAALTPAQLARLRNQVRGFFDESQKSYLKLDREGKGLKKAAKDAMSRTPSASLFVTLLGAEYGLLTRTPHLTQPIARDKGLPPLFTQAGCNAVKSPRENVLEWFSCVLPGVDRNIEWHPAYKTQYQKAWASWLLQVTGDTRLPLAPHGGKGGDDKAALRSGYEALDQLAGSSDNLLSQMLLGLGDATACTEVDSPLNMPKVPGAAGLMQKAQRLGNQLEAAKDAITDRDLCVQVQQPYCKLEQSLIGPTPLGTAWTTYKEALSRLKTELRNIHDNTNLPQRSLELVRATMDSSGPLREAGRAREDFFRELTQPGLWDGFESTSRDLFLQSWAQLNGALEGLEMQVWQVLVRLAAMGVQEQWQVKVMDLWNTNRARSGEEASEVCARYEAFRANVLEPFVASDLDPYYEGNRQRSGQLKGFMGASVPLCRDANAQITRLRDYRLVCGGGGEAPPLPEFVSFAADEFPTAVTEVRLDTGESISAYDTVTNSMRKLPVPSTGRVVLSLYGRKSGQLLGRAVPLGADLKEIVDGIKEHRRSGRIEGRALFVSIPAQSLPPEVGRAVEIKFMFKDNLIQPAKGAKATTLADLAGLQLPTQVSCP